MTYRRTQPLAQTDATLHVSDKERQPPSDRRRLLVRLAQGIGVGLFATPVFAFWMVLMLEKHIPDMTFREFAGMPYVYEALLLWTLVMALLVTAHTDPQRSERGLRR